MSSFITKISRKSTNTLVLIHGNSSSPSVFNHFVENHLQFSIINICLPGHDGHRSAKPEQDYSFEGLKSCVRSGIPTNVPVIIIGNSLGGHLAIEVAGDFPNCKGVVIFGTPPLKKPLNTEEAFLPSEALGTYFKADYTDEELTSTFSIATRNETVRKTLISDFINTDPLFRQYFAYSGLHLGQLGDEAKMVAELGKPVHVIHGLQDPSANLAYIKTLPGITQVHEIDNCGHYPSVEQPEQFAAIVKEIAEQIFGD